MPPMHVETSWRIAAALGSCYLVTRFLFSRSPTTPTSAMFKRVFLLSALLLCGVLSSCQCSHKPPVGPVEGESSVLVLPERDLA